MIDVCACMHSMNVEKRNLNAWELLPLPLLFEIRGRQPNQQHIVLALEQILQPQRGAFAMCTAMSSEPLMPGDDITARFNMEGLIETKDLANGLLLFMSNPIILKSIEYKIRSAANTESQTTMKKPNTHSR